VKRLAKFIGVECTDEQAKHVMETCSFDNMKKAEIELKEKALYDKEEGKSQIFRKGSLLVCFFYILLSYDFKKTLYYFFLTLNDIRKKMIFEKFYLTI